MLDFLSLVMALVALIAAFKAFNQVAVLRARLEAMEATPLQARPVQERPGPPPLPLHEELEQAPVVEAPGVAAEQPAAIDDAEPAAPPAADQDATPNDTVDSTAATPHPAAAATRPRHRRTHRHPLGGLGRWFDAGARRLLHGPLFDRGRAARTRRPHPARRGVRAGAARRRRMDPPQGKHLDDRSAADRQHSRDPDRRRNGRGLRDGLRRLRAIRFSRPRHRVRSARAGRARHTRRGFVARAGAGRPRHRRRLCYPDTGFLERAGLLGAVHLSRHRQRGGVRAGAHQAVALAGGHHHRAGAAVGLPLPAMRTLDGRPARVPCDLRIYPRRPARGVRIPVRAARPTKAGSNRSRPVRSRPVCWAQR